MATKKSSSKNRKMRIAALALIMFLAFYFMCFFVYQFISYKNAEIKTEVALKETVYSKIETKCFVLRDESFIKSSASGTTVSFAKNGQRIAAGDTVTMVFDSQDDAAAYLDVMTTVNSSKNAIISNGLGNFSTLTPMFQAYAGGGVGIIVDIDGADIVSNTLPNE